MAKLKYDDYLKKSNSLPGTNTLYTDLPSAIQPESAFQKAQTNYVPDPRYANSAGNYYYGGSMVSPTGVPTSVPIPNQQPTADSDKSGTDNSNTKQNLMNIYQAQIAQSSINQKAELAAINERANSYTNAYLKSLGLEGTAAGANAIANNNLNLMNAYNQVNANEQQAIQERESEANSQLYDLFTAAISSGKSSADIEKIIDNNAVSETQSNYYKSLLDASGITWESDRDNEIANIEANMDSLSKEQKIYVNDIIDQMNNAKTKDEYNAIYEKYKSVITNPTSVSSSNEAVNYKSSNIVDSIDSNTDFAKADIFENSGYGNKHSIRQDRWNNGRQSAASMPRSKEYDTIKDKIESKYGKVETGKAYYLDGYYYKFNWSFIEGYYLTAFKKK